MKSALVLLALQVPCSPTPQPIDTFTHRLSSTEYLRVEVAVVGVVVGGKCQYDFIINQRVLKVKEVTVISGGDVKIVPFEVK